MASTSLGGIGVWTSELRYGDDDAAVIAAARELESLGFTAIWLPDVGGDLFGAFDRLLGATSTITIASGILNVWKHDADETARWWASIDDARRARVMLGIGVSHGPFIGEAWRKPLQVMRDYFDALDDGGVPRERRCLAALGPKMLELARDRSAGAHPYLTTPEHTAIARDALGPDALLAVEQGVVLDTDAERARATSRAALAIYQRLPNYAGNWKRLGFTDDDIDSLSDRLVDGLVAWGDIEVIGARVDAHRDAGASHVCVQVLRPRGGAPVPLEEWRRLSALCS